MGRAGRRYRRDGAHADIGCWSRGEPISAKTSDPAGKPISGFGPSPAPTGRYRLGDAAGRDSRGCSEHARKRRRALLPFPLPGDAPGRRRYRRGRPAGPSKRVKGKRGTRRQQSNPSHPKLETPRKDRSRPHQKTIHMTDPDHIRETQKTPEKPPSRKLQQPKEDDGRLAPRFAIPPKSAEFQGNKAVL